MNEYLVAVILGVVEGLTEFIPVSSTGHMILVGDWLQFTGEKEATFEVVIQLGAILAVVVVFKDRFLDLLGLKREKNEPFPALRTLFFRENRLNLIHIGIAILPALILGYFLHKIIKTYLFSSETVIIGLVVVGLLMVFIEKIKPNTKKFSIDDISYWDALWIGVGQCFSLWPGTSRSGATIISGLFTGLSQKAAAEFSFIIAVPVMIAATSYDMLKSYNLFSTNDLMILLVGLLVSFIVAIVAIKWFLGILAKVTLAPFGWYRIAIGLLAYWVLLN